MNEQEMEKDNGAVPEAEGKKKGIMKKIIIAAAGIAAGLVIAFFCFGSSDKKSGIL